MTAVADVDGDSLLDVLVNEWPGKAVQWFRNPGNRTGDWAKHLAHPVVDNESPNWVDITGDGLQHVVTGNGRPDIVVANKKGGFVFLQKPASCGEQPRFPWRALQDSQADSERSDLWPRETRREG
ncbi:MAG: VCBS repeat-containing protein [Planctomycetota bacterium]